MSSDRWSDAEIERQRGRFDAAQKLIAEGKIEEARRIFWWPRNAEPPKVHWSRVPVHPCFCGKKTASGIIGLCIYCHGWTAETPKSIPRKKIS